MDTNRKAMIWRAILVNICIGAFLVSPMIGFLVMNVYFVAEIIQG